MLSVSNDFKTEIKKLEVYSDGKVSITNTSGTLNFTRDNIVKIDIFGSAFSNDKVLGNLAQHSLTLELLGDLTSSISLNKENIVKVDIGVLVNGVYEYVRFQDFLVTSVTYSDTSNVTQIVATDSIVKLNKEYVDTNTYPITLKAYLEDVLTQCGLELENTTFLNDNFVITSRPYNDGSSCKDIVSRISELALCFVQVNKTNNKIELINAFSPFMRGYTHTELSAFTHTQLSAFTHYELMHSVGLFDEELSKDNYWNLKLSDHWFGEFGINTLTLKISQVEGENNTKQVDELVSLEGNKSITISDNPFINSEALRLSVIDGMFDVVKLYKYYPYTLEYRGFPYLELGDSVQITNMNGDLFNSPIYEMTIRYDGGLYGKINASALSQVQTKYLNTQTLTQRVKTAEVKVDKINGDVTILAGDYYDGKLVGAKYVFDGDNATFYGGGLKIKNNDGDDVLYADTEGNLQLAGHIQMLQENEIVTVGTGGDFATINEALLFVQQKYPQFVSGTNTVSSAEIRLKAGFVMNEQVLVERLNLGFVTISSEDAEVVVNRSSITQSVTSTYDTFYPVFLAKENAVLPVINCLFSINTNGSSVDITGLLCLENSNATIRPNAGIKSDTVRLAYGCVASEGSTINADSSIFVGYLTGYFARKNSRINCNNITCDSPIFAYGASSINANDSILSGYSNSNGMVRADNASFINIQNSTISNNKDAIVCINASLINVNSSSILNNSGIGIYVINSSNVSASGCTITGSGSYSVQCYRSSLSVVDSNCRKGGSNSSSDIYVAGGGIISAGGSTGGLSQTANTITSDGIIFK